MRQEADFYIDRQKVPGGVVMHVQLHKQLAVFAGINPFGEWYVLWPKDPMRSANQLRQELCREFGLEQLGVIISDSKSTPLRRGVIGGAIAWAGFNPLYDDRHRKDLTGQRTGGSQINVAEAIAAAAVLVMGEGNEQTPVVIAWNAPYAFSSSGSAEVDATDYVVSLSEDIFAPFYDNCLWKKGGRK